MSKLTGKIALVTGASSGIGEATAQRLVRAGYTVYGTSRRGAAAGQRSFEMVPLDVTSDESVGAVITDVMRLAGRCGRASWNSVPSAIGEAEREALLFQHVGL